MGGWVRRDGEWFVKATWYSEAEDAIVQQWLPHGSRRRHLRFPATWPWATEIVAAFTAIRALTPLRT